jgi:hypothetical protein
LDLQLLGDSKIIIDWLNFRGKLQVSSLLGWMDRTQELQQKFRHITYLHTREKTTKKLMPSPRSPFRNKPAYSPTITGLIIMRAPLSS